MNKTDQLLDFKELHCSEEDNNYQNQQDFFLAREKYFEENKTGCYRRVPGLGGLQEEVTLDLGLN